MEMINMAVYKSKKATKDGRQYFFRIKYKDVLGVSHDYTSQKYKTQKEAVNEEALYRIKIGENKTSNNNITLGQAFNEFIEIHRKTVKKQTTNRILDKYKHLKKYENLKIKNLAVNSIKQIRKDIEDNNNLGYDRKNEILGLLRLIIKYSNKYYGTDTHILKFIDNFKNVNPPKKEMLFFTYEEYKQFDSVIEDHIWHTFFEMLYFIGLRQGECQALTWKDINFDKKTVDINKTLTSKIKGENWTISSPKTRNSIRELPLTEKLIEDLKIMKDKDKKLTDFSENWFVFGKAIPFKETTIQKKKNDICSVAEVKQIRIHDFRHSCASFLINLGASITLVSKFLGHSKVSITLDIYSHFYKSELDDIIERVNNL